MPDTNLVFSGIEGPMSIYNSLVVSEPRRGGIGVVGLLLLNTYKLQCVLPSRHTMNGNTPVRYTCILLFGLNKLRKFFHKLLKGNSSVSTFMFLKFYHFRTGSRLWGMVPILIWPWQEKLPFQTSAHRHHMTTLDSVKYLYSNLILTVCRLHIMILTAAICH